MMIFLRRNAKFHPMITNYDLLGIYPLGFYLDYYSPKDDPQRYKVIQVPVYSAR